MRRTWIIAFALAACSGGRANKESTGATSPAVTEAAAEPEKPSRPDKADKPDRHDGEDVTAEILAMNSDEHGPPPKESRKGHVSRRKAPEVMRTKHGFEVQFASHAPVVTPAVYDGKVYVSGGFRSKEFHAFHATTGKSAWSINLDDDGPSSAACERGVCVFNTESCTVFAVNAKTGKMLWSWWLGDPLTSSPAIADGRVFTSYPAHASGDPNKPKPPHASHAIAAFDLEKGTIPKRTHRRLARRLTIVPSQPDSQPASHPTSHPASPHPEVVALDATPASATHSPSDACPVSSSDHSTSEPLSSSDLPATLLPRRLDWAGLLQRVFDIDVSRCAHCGGRVRILAVLAHPDIAHPVLEHLGLPTRLPAPAPARSPPQLDLGDWDPVPDDFDDSTP